jgi:hypothetical protein
VDINGRTFQADYHRTEADVMTAATPWWSPCQHRSKSSQLVESLAATMHRYDDQYGDGRWPYPDAASRLSIASLSRFMLITGRRHTIAQPTAPALFVLPLRVGTLISSFILILSRNLTFPPTPPIVHPRSIKYFMARDGYIHMLQLSSVMCTSCRTVLDRKRRGACRHTMKMSQ